MASTLSCIVLANDAARCLAANTAACELTGYSEAELVARSILDLARPDSHDAARMLWGRFLINGECADDFLMVQKNGTEVAVQVCALAHIAPGLHATVADRAPVQV
jgi:PAS domain S-box-containing protein